MKIGIMQPYFLPYIGYWQLLNAVDKYIICDNMQFTKKGWMRHNYILQDGKPAMFTVPLKKDSRDLDICDRYIADQYFEKDAAKILRRIESAYRKAPHFKEVMPVLEQCFLCKEENLFSFIFNSVKVISIYLGITTEILVLSHIEMDHSLKKQDRVIETCKKANADIYINAIGGLELYDKEIFAENGIELKFIKSDNIEYEQFQNEFVPSLSIIDVMMFNSTEEIRDMLGRYVLI
ncbi:WbqC family protein [Methanolobus chelungpuianus]|uniref:WbqC-like protein n=1 Tax=Methanolobus chelungpuianus TaxID=502115 RepID=A0AAE3KZJ3_9EURY|nr:WbqC family protein [Methanolobus chelungpuianus]MCQ6963439.1 WbqC-like protein [Methanolobus chelungpuianus]